MIKASESSDTRITSARCIGAAHQLTCIACAVALAVAALYAGASEPSAIHAELSPLPPAESAANAKVLSAWRADFGDQTVVYRRVAPRTLPARPRAEPTPLTPQEAEALRIKSSKKQELLFLSCTVYDRRITAMRWEHEGQRYRAWSNIDGNYLRGLQEFETADTVYHLMLGIGEETEADIQVATPATAPRATPTPLPPREAFDSSLAHYLLPPDAPAPPASALIAINALHRFFEENKPALIAQYEQRLAAESERQRRLLAQPPAEKLTILEYWTYEAAAKAGIPIQGAQR